MCQQRLYFLGGIRGAVEGWNLEVPIIHVVGYDDDD